MTLLGILFILLTVLESAARSVLGLFAIAPDTGFYTGMGGLVLAHNLLYLVGAAVLALLILLPREEPSLPEYPGRTLPMLLAATGLVLCVGSFVSFFGDLYDFTAGGDTHFGRVVAGPFAIIAAVAMFYLGLRALHGEYRMNIWGASMPALWMAVQAVGRFMEYKTIASISDQTLEVVTLCVGALFWLAHARVVSPQGGLPARKAKFWALLFSLFSVSLCVGQAVATLAGRQISVQMPLISIAGFLLMGVYAALFAGELKKE